jgi:tetratricopeptide (TPR) repeat protein
MTLNTALSLASAWLRCGYPEQGLELMTHTYNLGRETLGDRHPATVLTMQQLGRLYNALGHEDLALAFLLSAIDRASIQLGARHARVGQLMLSCGTTLYNMGHFDPAESMILEAHDILVDSLGAENHLSRNCLTLLIRIYEETDRPEMAEQCSDRLRLAEAGETSQEQPPSEPQPSPARTAATSSN